PRPYRLVARSAEVVAGTLAAAGGSGLAGGVCEGGFRGVGRTVELAANVPGCACGVGEAGDGVFVGGVVGGGGRAVGDGGWSARLRARRNWGRAVPACQLAPEAWAFWWAAVSTWGALSRWPRRARIAP